MKDEPFYSTGLKFSCKRCSSCCRYDAGYVYLSENDLKKLVSCMEMDRDSFIGVYCRWVKDWKGRLILSLKEKSNSDCVFWNSENGCLVYEFRPVQCRNFPFWESIVSSKENWNMASNGCPGMNSGELFTKEAIKGLIEMSKLEPIVCKGGKI